MGGTVPVAGLPQGCTQRVGLQQGGDLPNKDLGSPTMCRGAHLFVFLIHSRILPTPRPPPPHGLLPCPRPLPLSWWPHGHSAGAPGSCHHGHSAAGRDLPGSPCADCVSPLPASHHHQDLLRDWAHELPSGLLLLLRGVGAASRAGASCWVLSLGNPVLVALAELLGTVGTLAQGWHWSSRGVPG